MSLFEKEAVVEASLGGRITAEEIVVFGEELSELLETFDDRPFSVLLDYSKAKRMDEKALYALGEVKDLCLEYGAAEIVSVAGGENDSVDHETARLQFVLEGKERFVEDPAQANFVSMPFRAARLAA